MNKSDRKQLEKALELLDQVKIIIEEIRDAEQEKFDNLSEGLQQTERGQKFEQNVSNLEYAFDELESAYGNIEESMES